MIRLSLLIGLGCSLPCAAAGELGAFRPAGTLHTARYLHTATRLLDGRVLVVGGRGIDGTVELDSVELYDPKTNRWQVGPKLEGGRSGHTATLLTDGRVLNAPLAELRTGREDLDSDGTLEGLERQYIIRVLRDTSGIIAGPRGAAVRLGMKRTTLQSRILRMGISIQEYE